MTFQLDLLGALQLFDPDGSDVTPRGEKTKGLLAILAMQHGRPIARPALQDLLWSDRDNPHGRDSLKKSLAALKKSFAATHHDIVQTSGGPVTLNLTHINVDLFQDKRGPTFAQNEFLQGIDIRDPEFDRWLCNMRQSLDVVPVAANGLLTGPIQRKQFHVAIVAPTTSKSDDFAALFSGLLLDRIAVAMRGYDIFKVFDFRVSTDEVSRGADFVLDLKALSMADEVAFHLIARKLPDNEVVWGHRQSFPKTGFGTSKISALVSDVVDSMSLAIRRTDGEMTEQSRAARFAMEGIDQIFRLTDKNLDKAETALGKAIHLDPNRSTYRAWHAFMHAFRLENSKGINAVEIAERADECARQALEVDHSNPLTRSLLTHVYAFVLHDFDQAHSLIRPLNDQTPDLPFYYMSKTFLHFYTGQMTEAKKAAAGLSGSRPTLFGHHMFDVARTAAELGTGNLKRAIEFGELAVSNQSGNETKYEPSLRYLAAAHAKAGNIDRSRYFVRQLELQSPGVYQREFFERAFMAPTDAVRNVFPTKDQIKSVFT
ncbi:MAG: hypothetical protein AAGA08_01660 [Pseudomonadota bacterium]